MPLSAWRVGRKKHDKQELSITTTLKKNVKCSRVSTHTVNKKKPRVKHLNTINSAYLAAIE